MLRSITVCVALASAVLLGRADGTRADTLASYPFDAGTTTPGPSPTAESVVTPANATVSLLTTGPGLGGNSSGGFANASTSNAGGLPVPSLFSRASATTSTVAGAIAGNDYFSFTITPDPGYAMNLSTLSFDHAKNQVFASGSSGAIFASSWAVLSDIDGFTSVLGSSTNSLALASGPPSSSGDNNPAPWISFALDLDDPSFGGMFQDLDAPVEFRLYTFDNSSREDGLNRIDNILLEGDVFIPAVIPEPSSIAIWMLLALSAALAIRGRWRRG